MMVQGKDVYRCTPSMQVLFLIDLERMPSQIPMVKGNTYQPGEQTLIEHRSALHQVNLCIYVGKMVHGKITSSYVQHSVDVSVQGAEGDQEDEGKTEL